MNIFELRQHLINDYSSYVRSFFHIKDTRIKPAVDEALGEGLLWTEPLIQLNPAFEPGSSIADLVKGGVLHPECEQIFRKGKSSSSMGRILSLHKHQEEAIRIAQKKKNFVITTGTGSGKSLCYIIPIVNAILKAKITQKRIKAIIVYPMNALANSQQMELEKFLCYPYPDGQPPVTFRRYTGQESDMDRQEIISNPPDILLTNYVMMDLILTRTIETNLLEAAQGLQFLVFDELHTYRGRQGADVALLIRRVRNRLDAHNLLCIGTSATIAGSGSYQEQQKEVAKVASLIFGDTFEPQNVIGETLQRITPEVDLQDIHFQQQLKQRVFNSPITLPKAFHEFIEDPLSIWIESTFGVERDPKSKRLRRVPCQTILGEKGAAKNLNEITGLPVEECSAVIQQGLLAGYKAEPSPLTGFSPFAFRLHQFIGRGDTVYASLEPEDQRYVSVFPQHFCPGHPSKVLYPLLFCRECGQEYYSVWKNSASPPQPETFAPRPLLGPLLEDGGEPGYLYLSTGNPWGETQEELLDRLPMDWLEGQTGDLSIVRERKKDLPKACSILPNGMTDHQGQRCHYVSMPFLFCLNCGVSYTSRQSDYAKLSSLNSGGRSTSTTILSLSTIRHLRKTLSYANNNPLPAKLLSFTDNRQDASLQSGHFNDFIEVGLLRSALYKAASESGESGLRYDNLTQKVFQALNLSVKDYAQDPDVKYHARQETDFALREVLGYRLYRDLKRGWRITLPNLEQCGLIEIHYLSLEELCRDESEWSACHKALAEVSPEQRSHLAKVLLDHLRRELVIKVPYLDFAYWEGIRQKSNQRLITPWAIEEDEKSEYASVGLPRSQRRGDDRHFIFVSARSGYGRFLNRKNVISNNSIFSLQEREQICREVLERLRIAGIVARVYEPKDADDVPGYQIEASAMIWTAGDGSRAFHDFIRVPNPPREGLRTNQFFVDFYKNVAQDGRGIHAHEHTAQVRKEIREQREQDFRQGNLPILYCSPTMELGVDIAELNVVNMRNVPPTPANYAQRSGRAGRSGQPALVFTYCTSGSPHDQYYFKRPRRMVSGAVNPPRLELANEDLLQSHIQAIWLAEAKLWLGKTLKDVLKIEGDNPSLAFRDHVLHALSDGNAKQRAYQRAKNILQSIESELEDVNWYQGDWLGRIIDRVAETFDQACDRWRGLYRNALSQAQAQDRIIRDVTRSESDRRQAVALRREAESQLNLLCEQQELSESDFYSYRYFASENFLPGYSFPRLPISAYIPGRRQRDEYLSRPRFLAITEFGPRAYVYHEGSRFQINRVVIPVQSDDEIITTQLKQCPSCGYLHIIHRSSGPDLCERCHEDLGRPYHRLFRLQSVSTKRRDRINADEEERMRLGYEIRTGFCFSERDGLHTYRMASVKSGSEVLMRFNYDKAATIWRMNLGWRRRENKHIYGFNLDVERGYWQKNQLDFEDADDPTSQRIERVIPYVEDRKNSLLLELTAEPNYSFLVSLTSALKNAIQVYYQLEDNELAVELLPNPNVPQFCLFYEAAEGGAGVLRRILDDPNAFNEIAQVALGLCHFNPQTGEDVRRAPHSKEDCEKACYDCLMTYSNQPHHSFLDRHAIREFLQKCASSKLEASSAPRTREEHLEFLDRNAGSELERRWLNFIEKYNLKLPTETQKLFESLGTRPDFTYGDRIFIYVDGPPHDFPDRIKRDLEQQSLLEDCGITVIRFHHQDNWLETVNRYPTIFGCYLS